MGNPDASKTFYGVTRNGKCCPADEWWTQNKADQYRCVSYNVRLDWDAVGVEIIFEHGATPDVKDWRVDCQPVSLIGNTVCLPGGAFHLFTYCKQGNNPNDITFHSIKGASANSELATRVECNQNLSVTGVSNPVWKSIYPVSAGVPEGYYNKYLFAPGSSVPGSGVTSTTPIFRADSDSPAEIRYEVCGDLAQTVCNNISRDCDVVTIYVKEKIDLTLDINPDLICINTPTTITPAITPAGTYRLDWKSPSGVITPNTFSYTASGTESGTYTVTVTDMQQGIPCSSKDFSFNLTFDQTGPNFPATEPPLEIQCNATDYVNTINTWRSKFQATYINAQGNTVTATVTDDFDFSKLNMTCGNVVTVTFTAPDQCVNYSVSTSTITVIDNIKPTMTTSPQNMTVECDGAGNIAAFNAWLASNGGAVSVDDCGTVTWTRTVTPLSDLCGMTGVATATFTARDACGNGVSSTATFTIIDTQPPLVTGSLGVVTIEACVAANAPVAVTTIAALEALGLNISDACSPDAMMTVTSTDASSGTCPVVITRTYTIADDCGNTATAIQTINIKDTTPPAITCPGPFYENADPGTCTYLPFTIGIATATDTCGGTVSITNNAPAQFLVGVTTVTWTATDECGNQSTCDQYVTIYDIEPPVINCIPSTYSVTVSTGQCGVSFGLVTPTYTENCGAPITVTAMRSDGLLMSADFPIGVTTVVFTVTDKSNNATTCTQTVIVIDDITPTITCPPDQLAIATAPLCQVPALSIPNPTINDNCSTATLTLSWIKTGSTTDTGTGTVSGTNFNVGITTVTYTVADASGNSASCSFRVTVNDQVPPTITDCPDDVNVNAGAGICEANVTVPAPVVFDPCGEPFVVSHNSPYSTSSSTTDASGTYPVGTTTVIWTIIDRSGNISTCTQTITVTDNQPPTLVCPPSFSIPADANKDYASNVTIPLPTHGDNCGTYTLTWTLTNNSGVTVSNSTNTTGVSTVPSPYPQLFVGSNSITYTLTDLGGGVLSCTFVVTITSKPEIDCPASIVTYTASNNCGSTLDPGVATLIEGAQPITWTWTIDSPLSADVSGISTSTVSDPTPDPIGLFTFDHGTTTITWSATNLSGTDSCTQTITVIDNIPPVYTPPPTPVEYCVENLISATYSAADPDLVIINPDPDYYLFRTGVNSDTSLDLNVSNIDDNCCPGTTTWTITFSPVPDPANPGNTITYLPVSGSGQPSAYPSNIQLWGDGVNFATVVHQISYTVTDCHGNATTFTRSITVNPRPKLTKMP